MNARHWIDRGPGKRSREEQLSRVGTHLLRPALPMQPPYSEPSICLGKRPSDSSCGNCDNCDNCDRFVVLILEMLTLNGSIVWKGDAPPEILSLITSFATENARGGVLPSLALNFRVSPPTVSEMPVPVPQLQSSSSRRQANLNPHQSGVSSMWTDPRSSLTEPHPNSHRVRIELTAYQVAGGEYGRLRKVAK